MIFSGTELRRRRVARGLTQVQLARESGVSQSLVARIESGSVDPRLSTLSRISECLDGHKPTAGDLMSSPVLFAVPEDTVAHVVAEMSKFSISQMPVMDKNSQVGSIVDSFIVRLLVEDPDGAASTAVSRVMRKPFPEVPPGTALDAVNPLLEKSAAVLISDRGVVKGIISRADVLRGLA